MNTQTHTDTTDELARLLEHHREIDELLGRAAKLASELPRSRAAALVATKVDEAKLWLTRVEIAV